jgi:hypothetical protein
MARPRTTSLRLGATLVACAVIGLLAPSTSAAATTLGQLPPGPAAAGSFGLCPDGLIDVQNSVAAAGPAYTVPAGGGVITSWSFKSAAYGGTVKLKVFQRPASPDTDPWPVAAEGADGTLGPNETKLFAARIPVAAGSVLGLLIRARADMLAPTNWAPCYFDTGDAGDNAKNNNIGPGGNPPPGMSQSWSSSFPSARVNVSAVLEPDTDGDGFGDESQDNCPGLANPSQADSNGDGKGDACDTDSDGILNAADNCPDASNADQANQDGDSFGDACDPDIENDGVANGSDNCPRVANSDQSDIDLDGLGDACDADIENDGVANGSDNCPRVANSDQSDLDADGVGDVCDPTPFKPGPCANLRGGTIGADVLVGTAGGDALFGSGGNDSLAGLAGDDCLNGESGDDVLDGGEGNDSLSGGDGSDRLSGRAGNDRLTGGDGNDRLSGNAGNDRLAGGGGRNRYFGGAGRDTINSANFVPEKVSCGSGKDSVTADRRDRLSGCEKVRRR